MEIIHIVLGKANPNRMNGVNKVVYQLAVKQTELGSNVSVWGITKNLRVNYEERNFKTQLFLKFKNPFSISNHLKKVILTKKNKAIFHLHGGWIPIFYSLGRFLHKNQMSFVFTPHGAYNTIAMERNYWIKKIYFHLFEKQLLSRAEKIHCIGKSEVKGLNKIYTNNKSVLLPYGYENNISFEYGITQNKAIVFGFIGRLDIYTKGLDTLVKAYVKFNSYNPNSKLWIIGDSNTKSDLEKLIIDLNLTEKIILFGSKFGNEKNVLDVFVHPSRNEGLPTSVIEAASFGKPCIVTDATNIGELIQKYDAGITIPIQSSKQLFRALKEIHLIWNDSSQYKTICSNAIQMVNETYNWEKVIADLNENLYQIQ
jgi:glycosyltransferase involved in cell wall biosynthesis